MLALEFLLSTNLFKYKTSQFPPSLLQIYRCQQSYEAIIPCASINIKDSWFSVQFEPKYHLKAAYPKQLSPTPDYSLI